MKAKKVLIVGIVTLVLIGTSNLSFGMGDVVDSFDSPSNNPEGLAWGDGYLWLSDPYEDKIYKINPSNGNVVKTYNTPIAISTPCGLAWYHGNSNLYIVDFIDKMIYRVYPGPVIMQLLDWDDCPGDYPAGLAY